MNDEIYQEVANKLGFPKEVIKLAYLSYWKFIRSTIKDLPLKEDLSKEEFSLLRTNFNIPSLGKLNCTYDRITRLNNKYINSIKKYNDKNK